MTTASTATATRTGAATAPVAGFITAGPTDNKKLTARIAELTEALALAVAAGDDALILAAARRLGQLRPIYASYLPIGTPETHGGTCPATCVYVATDRARGVICYAGGGHTVFSAIDSASRSMVIVAEAARLPVNAIIRHAVTGNPSPDYIRQMHAAARLFPAQDHFTYVHGWRAPEYGPALDLAAPNLAVNVSCDTASEVGAALADRRDAVMVAMPGEWSRLMAGGGSAVADVPTPNGGTIAARIVACPEQRADKRVNCATCPALCRKPGRFDPVGRPIVVAFNAHAATRLVRAATIRRRAESDGRLAIVE